jgi:hypothetical protein
MPGGGQEPDGGIYLTAALMHPADCCSTGEPKGLPQLQRHSPAVPPEVCMPVTAG